MKKVLSLIVALGIVALFSGVTLAGADCSYHKTQAAVDKTDAAKDVATAPATDKAVTGPRCRQLRPANRPNPLR